MPEISDEEFKVLAGSKKLLDTLLANPKTMRDQQKLIKAVHPDVTTIDDNPIMGEVRDLSKKFDDYVGKQRDREIDEKLDNEFGLLKQDGWQPEGLEKLKQFMVDEGIRSPLNAAAAWDRRNPPSPQPPSLTAPTGWMFGEDSGDKNMEDLFKNEDAWAEKEASRTLQEFRTEKIRT